MMKNNLTLRPFLKVSARSLLRSGLGSLAHSALVLAGSMTLTSAGMAAPLTFSTSAGNKTVAEGTLAAANTVKWVIADPAPAATYEMTVRVLDKDLNLAPAGFTINLIGTVAGVQAGTADSSNHIRTRTTLTNLNSYLNNAQVTMPTDFWTIAATRELKILVSVDTNLDGDYTNDPLVETIDIAVTNVNDAPSFTRGSDITVLEDSGNYPSTAWATAVSPGGGVYPDPDTLTFSITATSNPGNISGLSLDSAGNISFATVLDSNGTSAISVTLNDGTTTTAAQTRNIILTAVNDAPFLVAPSSPAAVNEDAGAQTVSAFIDIPNVNRGGTLLNEQAQTLTFTVTNDNNALFTTQPAISGTTGNLTFTPAANANGSTTVTVTPKDNGLVANGGIDTGIAKTFTITVNPVNDAPTLTAITSPAAILEDAAQQTINLAGITSGAANESQVLVVTATSSNTALIPDPTVTYTSANATGSLAYTPVPDANGSATITVTVNDGGGGSETIVRAFTVAVTAVNDQPALAAIATPADILEDAIQQTVNLTGIGKGPANESSAAQFLFCKRGDQVWGGLVEFMLR